MSSIALALKYRPTCFDDLVGQNAISQTLRLALDSKHISHAYLFSGLRGSGKTSSARIFARALQCEKGPTSTPCGECASCVDALQNKHIDIIEMDAASSRGIDDIKRVIEQTKYRPSLARFKIFIIDEVHMLSKEAFNALLKTLEEPPEFVKFILATTDPLKLPATILSRTQHFRFKQIPFRLVVEHITQICNKENVIYDIKALEILARSGYGSLRDTLTLLDQAIIFCKNHLEVAAVTDMLGVVDPQVLLSFFESIMQNDENKANEILALLQEYECEMILDEMMSLLKSKLIEKDVAFPPLIVDRYARILSESKSLLHLNTDGAFVLLLCKMKMQEALKIKDIESMISELENDIFSQNAHSLNTAQNPAPQRLSQNAKNLAPQNTQNQHLNAPNSADSINTNVANATNPTFKAQMQFQALIDKLKDRNLELGESFEKCIKFVSFENAILRWESTAEGEDRERLKGHYKIIKGFVLELFGQDVSIEQVAKETQEADLQETAPDSMQKSPRESNSDSINTTESAQDLNEPINENLARDSINSTEISNAQEAQNAENAENTENALDLESPNAINAKSAFIAKNRDLIKALQQTVGIKEVIVPQDTQK